MRRLGLAAMGLAALLTLGLAANTGLRWAGWTAGDEAPAERLARLAPHWRLVRPPGEGPAPLAVLLSGCDGPHDNMDLWADLLAREGWAALILDSHAPRGLAGGNRWRLVCSGQALTGAERAGDLAVAMDALDGTQGIDARAVLLLGASHGGWAAMELMALAERGRVPPGLTAWPEPPDALLAQVAGVVLLYPYCGPANGAAGGWDHPAPVVMMLAAQDEVVSVEACRDAAGALAARGVPARLEVIEGAGHGFDQRARASLSPLSFDARATRRTAQRVVRLARDLRAEAHGPLASP